MGKRLQNWLDKTPNKKTKALNRRRWGKFAKWCVTTKNPLTDQPYFACHWDAVDEQVRVDFEDMKTALFLDKYRDIRARARTAVIQPHHNLQAQVDKQAQEIHSLKSSLHTLQELNVEHRQQLQDFEEKMMVLLSSEIALQKLDLLPLQDLTQQQSSKDTALQAYQLHLTANLQELEEMQRQLLQDPDLKKIYHRQLTQQISDKDYQDIMNELKNTQFLRD